MNLYSFIESPLNNAMKHLVKLFPGIERIVSLTYSSDTDRTIAKFIESIQMQINDLDIDDVFEEIEKFRNTNNLFNWIKKSDLPFEVKQTRKSLQMNVFEELDNIVLVLAYPNNFDNKKDLLIIFFNQDHSNFGLSSSKTLLTPDHKKIIGYILYNNINSLLLIANNDMDVLKSVNENTQLIIGKLNRTKEELLKTKNSYTNSLLDLCEYYLKSLSEKYPKFKYTFSDETIKQIRTYNGDFIQLKSIIENAVIFVNNLYFNSKSKEIVLSEEYFNFEQEVALIEKPTKGNSNYDRYTKTVQLLDKLENAARDVIAKNLDLTGNNVGNACSIPISAPAISDALKKHRNKIIVLFEKYENKWTTIRKDFRPIKNIIAPRNNLLDKSA